MAIIRHNKKIIELLITTGVDVNAQSHNGLTALHNATYSKQLENVDLLLKKCARPELRSNGELSPLHVAAHLGELAITKRLCREILTEIDG